MLTSAVSKTAVAVLLTMSVSVWHPGGGEFKCFEDYRCITCTGTPQYELQQKAWTDAYGLRRIDGFYCVALGSAYGTEIGTKYIVKLSTGAEFLAILADQKADCDTVEGHTRDRNGAVIEFVVDQDSLTDTVRRMGDVSYVPGFDGEVEMIRRLKK